MQIKQEKIESVPRSSIRMHVLRSSLVQLRSITTLEVVLTQFLENISRVLTINNTRRILNTSKNECACMSQYAIGANRVVMDM